MPATCTNGPAHAHSPAACLVWRLGTPGVDYPDPEVFGQTRMGMFQLRKTQKEEFRELPFHHQQVSQEITLTLLNGKGNPVGGLKKK